MQLHNSSSDVFSRRKISVIFFMVLIGLIYLSRLFYIQVVDHRYKIFASSNVQRVITDYAARGLIYDRNGELLVYNDPYYDLMVIPGQVGDIDTTEFI
ncbi:MAG: hypothetical protein ACOC2E_08355, partial [Bacteroidota bacterium]